MLKIKKGDEESLFLGASKPITPSGNGLSISDKNEISLNLIKDLNSLSEITEPGYVPDALIVKTLQDNMGDIQLRINEGKVEWKAVGADTWLPFNTAKGTLTKNYTTNGTDTVDVKEYEFVEIVRAIAATDRNFTMVVRANTYMKWLSSHGWGWQSTGTGNDYTIKRVNGKISFSGPSSLSWTSVLPEDCATANHVSASTSGISLVSFTWN